MMFKFRPFIDSGRKGSVRSKRGETVTQRPGRNRTLSSKLWGPLSLVGQFENDPK
jgi:hypothetical protein